MAQTVPLGGNAIVADDSLIMRDAVRAALGDAWQIFPARSGLEAIELARSLVAHLVILDIEMPAMPAVQGLEACTAIRALPGYQAVPIIILTAFEDRYGEKAMYAGANVVLGKPFTRQQLRAAVDALLDSASATASRDRADGSEVLSVWRKVETNKELPRHQSYLAAVAAAREAFRR